MFRKTEDPRNLEFAGNRTALTVAAQTFGEAKDEATAEDRRRFNTDLQALLSATETAETKEDSALLEEKNKKIEGLRQYLLTEFLARETAENAALCDQAFALLLLFTQLWPRNKKDDSGRFIDCQSGASIAPENQVASSCGEFFDKERLQKFYNAIEAYDRDHETNRIGFRIPGRVRERLSPRELSHFEAQGLTFPGKELSFHVNAAISVKPDFELMLGIDGEPYNNRLGTRLLTHLRASPRNNTSPLLRRFSEGAIDGYRLGAVTALLGLCFVLILLMSFFAPGSGFILVGLALSGGAVEYAQSGSFRKGLNAAFFGCMLLCAATYLVPLVLGALGALSLISSAVLAASMKIYGYLLYGLLATAGVVGGLRECFEKGAMRATFEKTYKAILSHPLTQTVVKCVIFLGGAIFAFFNGLLDVGAKFCERRPVAPPPPAPLEPDEGEPGVLLDQNRRIHAAVGTLGAGATSMLPVGSPSIAPVMPPEGPKTVPSLLFQAPPEQRPEPAAGGNMDTNFVPVADKTTPTP